MFKLSEIKTAISMLIKGASEDRPLEEVLNVIRGEVEDWERGLELDACKSEREEFVRNYDGK